MYNPTKPYKKKIFELIEKTWQTPYVSVEKNVYPIIKRKSNFIEVDHTDGIGSKGVYHWKRRTFKNAVLDVLAMNLNDLALMRAIPYKMQNHIILPQDDHQAILKIVREMSKECVKRKIAMTGGETSIHNNMDGMDIGMTVSGIIKNARPNQIEPGDVIIGLKSNGLHSNGFTKVRELFSKEILNDFTKPTKIYLDEILLANKSINIHGMMHITGGAFSKLKDIACGADVILDQINNVPMSKIFKTIYQKMPNDMTMYETFNCGIGFVLSVSEKDVKKVLTKMSDAHIIGHAKKGSGKITIRSSFSNKNIEL